MMYRIFAILLTFFSCSLLAADLTIYSGRSEALIGPLMADFEKDSGLKVDVRYNSTQAVATQFLNESALSPADVIFLQESGYLTLLRKAGLLQPLSPALLAQIEPHLQDEQGFWLGSSARVRVLAYNTDKLKPEDLPKDLKELTDPKWKGKIGWAPTNASMQAHVSALRHLWGDEPTLEWLKGVKANVPHSYQKNPQIVNAVEQGEILIGWTNHYYAHQFKKQNPKLPVANYHFPESGKAGNILIISGAAISKHAKNKENAEKFLAFLASEKAQHYFTYGSSEYPTRKGMTPNPVLTPLKDIPFATVTQEELAEIEPTVNMLRGLGLM